MAEVENKKPNSKEILYDALKYQKESKKSILTLMQVFAESTEPIDINSVDETKNYLENLKVSLDLCNKNINTLESLTKNTDNPDIFNNVVIENSKNVLVPSQSDSIEENKTIVSQEPDVSYTIKESKDTKSIEQNNNNSLEENSYVENTLVISEKSGTVILPFQLSTLKQELMNSNNNYSSIDEIIKKDYSLPISLFKNPFVARFRESYKLMRKKEKSSIKEAFDLGLELMFNYNLHPAIISACKNIDELDIYLDYLDSGETNKFKFFKVLFEIAPSVVKSKHEF